MQIRTLDIVKYGKTGIGIDKAQPYFVSQSFLSLGKNVVLDT